jgi:hypothetical protein
MQENRQRRCCFTAPQTFNKFEFQLPQQFSKAFSNSNEECIICLFSCICCGSMNLGMDKHFRGAAELFGSLRSFTNFFPKVDGSNLFFFEAAEEEGSVELSEITCGYQKIFLVQEIKWSEV